MEKSKEEAMSIIAGWKDDKSLIRLAYSGPKITLWFPAGFIASISGSVFTFSFGSGELTADLQDCKIGYEELREIPAAFKEKIVAVRENVLQIESPQSGKLMLFQPLETSFADSTP